MNWLGGLVVRKVAGLVQLYTSYKRLGSELAWWLGGQEGSWLGAIIY